MREGSLEAPTRHRIAWEDPDFTDRKKTEAEMHRIFDICHTCRRCFNLCDAFPRLFDLIDSSASGELDTVAAVVRGLGSVVVAYSGGVEEGTVALHLFRRSIRWQQINTVFRSQPPQLGQQASDRERLFQQLPGTHVACMVTAWPCHVEDLAR